MIIAALFIITGCIAMALVMALAISSHSEFPPLPNASVNEDKEPK